MDVSVFQEQMLLSALFVRALLQDLKNACVCMRHEMSM